MTAYPEHDKLKEIAPFSQAIGDFIVWLQTTQDMTICERPRIPMGHYLPTPISINGLLTLYFGINQSALEAEKREILEEQRALTASLSEFNEGGG